ncbi:hypothetical protein [Lysinibacillus odysseyi]|uniref:Uncharacterized protein n=1 Tax=Lysinibacillus odysseyi 34hs-1 = NBRC 100172 TaxID=1220589 RepID=A0A0A3JBJ3_9BACI|nr:hypothetical protein [Lysinibacillus odysseyi]KGR84387.1 hypothetical protein CD32_12405 [Lysinibacillus odysseyi 34hs-1 = NBRC 100172]
MKKQLIGLGLVALAALLALQMYHYKAERELKKEIGRAYHVNMVNISIAFEGLEYERLKEMETDNSTYTSLNKLYFTLMYTDFQTFKGQPEIKSLLSDISNLLSVYKSKGELTEEQQAAFNSNVRKVKFLINDFEDILGTEIDWYYAFMEPNEKIQSRVKERLVMDF